MTTGKPPPAADAGGHRAAHLRTQVHPARRSSRQSDRGGHPDQYHSRPRSRTNGPTFFACGNRHPRCVEHRVHRSGTLPPVARGLGQPRPIRGASLLSHRQSDEQLEIGHAALRSLPSSAGPPRSHDYGARNSPRGGYLRRKFDFHKSGPKGPLRARPNPP